MGNAPRLTCVLRARTVSLGAHTYGSPKTSDERAVDPDHPDQPFLQSGYQRMVLPAPAATNGTAAANIESELFGQLKPGTVFMMGDNPALPRMPPKPRPLDFFKSRVTDLTCRHLLTSAKRAMDAGQEEKIAWAV